MAENLIDCEEYMRQVLAAYRATPQTTGRVHAADRRLAVQLYERGVPLRAIENALVLATARRLVRPVDALPLGTIRSLAYFVPVIQEVLETKGRRKNNFTDWVRSCSSIWVELGAVSVAAIEAVRAWVQCRWDSCDGRGWR